MNFREMRSRRYYGEYSDHKNDSNLFFLEEDCRKCADYAHSAFQSLDTFRKSGIMCDVRLVADSVLDIHNDTADDSIQAHKCILAAKSDYFKALFTKSESSQQTIRIQNVSHDILKKVIDFIYKGCCKVTQGEVKYITAAAAMMQIPTLFEECLDHFDVYNVFVMWSVADSLQVVDLLKCCTDFISKHLGVLLEQDEFYHLPVSKVYTILKLPKINLGPKYNLQVLRDALRKWMVVNKENGDQRRKLEGHVDCENLGISFQTTSEESPSHTRRLEATSRITEFPDCFSLIAVMGGSECGRCFPTVPAGPNVVACRGANSIEMFDTQSLTWVNTYLVMYPWPIHCSTFFLSDGMIYFLAKGGTSLSYQSNTTPKVTLHRFEPVLSRIIKVRDVQDGEGLARLAASRGYVRAMTDDGEEIFCCGSIRVRSEESGRVAFKINWKKNTAEDLPKLPLPRYHHSAVVVDGDLFIIGGCNIAGEPLASVLILRKGQDEWEEGISMLYARIGPGVAVLGDYIYAVGGTGVEKCLKTVERYHVGSHNIWELVSVMNCSRVFAGVVAAGGSLFVFGGQTYAGTREDSGTRTVLRICEKYDPCTDSWTALPDMSRGRCQMVTVTV